MTHDKYIWHRVVEVFAEITRLANYEQLVNVDSVSGSAKFAVRVIATLLYILQKREELEASRLLLRVLRVLEGQAVIQSAGGRLTLAQELEVYIAAHEGNN
jgi:hypothetical protein